jgi:hypothetical protein
LQTANKWRVVGYFFVGLGWDALVCADVICTAHGLWLGAGILSFLLTALLFEVYNKLVRERLDRPCVYSLAVGSAVGSMIAVRFLEIY